MPPIQIIDVYRQHHNPIKCLVHSPWLQYTYIAVMLGVALCITKRKAIGAMVKLYKK